MKMHFLIPDTDECKSLHSEGAPYTVFNVHINGVYHCSVRYRQLHSFNEQLKKEFGVNVLPAFPPKRILSLSLAQLEERRLALEKYIQLVSQNQSLCSSGTFHKFLLTSQQESQNVDGGEKVELEVYLMNGHRIAVTVKTDDDTDAVLEATASSIQLAVNFVYYFGLYLVRKEESKDNAIVRKLRPYESPFLSLKIANHTGTHRIVLRKAYWEPAYEDDLTGDRIAMNLLYVQAVSDVERGWVETSEQELQQLRQLKQLGSKKDYLALARTLKFYGYLQFQPCLIDYPEAGSSAVVKAGNRDFTVSITVAGSSQQAEETRVVTFRVTRMRCWRITTTLTKDSEDKMATRCHDDPLPCRLELAFEYLVAKDTLQWITITSDQAIVMSMSLQEMVDELIHKRNGGHIRRVDERRTAAGQGSVAQTTPTKPTSPSKASTTKGTKHSQPTLTENNAFDGIGDDDL